jgi:Protein of unknown function (DUF3285)
MTQTPNEPVAEPVAEPVSEPITESGAEAIPNGTSPERPPSFVKLAMRNMVRKGGKSLYHFALTSAGLFAVLIGLAYLTH